MTSGNGTTRDRLLYREVNKRIREVSETFGADGRPRFLCECGTTDCTATFELTLAQFDGLLSDSARVLLSASHRPLVTDGKVLAEYDGFLVVAADQAA